VRMPFGKHQGTEVSELPTEYLLWLLGNLTLHDPLLSALEEEALERGLELPPLPRHSLPLPKQAQKTATEQDWTIGGDPQEIIQGDFPLSSRK